MKRKKNVVFTFEPDGTPAEPINPDDYIKIPVTRNGKSTTIYLPKTLCTNKAIGEK